MGYTGLLYMFEGRWCYLHVACALSCSFSSVVELFGSIYNRGKARIRYCCEVGVMEW